MPITLNGDTGIQTPMYNGTITANAVTPSVNMKNRIINGAMTIDQRNAGASVTVNGNSPFITDRFRCDDATDGAYTAQQVSTAPAGFNNSVQLTVTTADTSLSASQYALFYHSIEGNNVADLNWGTANAKTVTLSFWVRSSLTGTFSGSLENNANNRSYVFTYAISVADTWEQKSITIVGDTSGTWETGNAVGIRINWNLGAGSDFLGTAGAWGNRFFGSTGSVALIGTNSATWFITGCQLEVGSTATSFDYRPYGTELMLCQRYFYRMNGLVNQDMLVGAAADQTTWIRYSFALPVIMRTTPSLVSTAASTYSNLTGSGGQAGSAIALDNSSATNVTLNLNSGGITAGSAATFRIGSNPTGYVAFSSEL